SGLHGGNYMFTAESIANLPAYYREISDSEVLNPQVYPNFHTEQMNATGLLISEDFIDSFPERLKSSYFDTPAWKIIAIIAIIAIAFAVAIITLVWMRFAYHRTALL